MSTKLRPIDVDGRKFDLEVQDDGQFVTEHDGDTIRVQTLDGLKAVLRRRLRRETSRIQIPITIAEGNYHHSKATEFVDGDIVGAHASNSNFLFRHETRGKAQTVQVSKHASNVFRRMTEAEKQKFARLEAAIKSAEQAFEAFRDDLKVDPRELLAKAWGEKIEEQED